LRKTKSSKAKGTFMSTESKAKRVERQARLTLKNCKAQKIDDGGGFLTALGGVTSLAKAAEVTGLVAMAVERIEPWRDEGLVEHEIKTLLSQRLYLGLLKMKKYIILYSVKIIVIDHVITKPH
jgi:hypothetical protein